MQPLFKAFDGSPEPVRPVARLVRPRWLQALRWALGLSIGLGALSAQAETPEESLKALVARQQSLLAEAVKKPSQNELEDLRKPLQELCNDYEDFLRKHPKLAAGFVSYALLLDHPVIDERRRSTALLLRANQIDPEMALVKNQLGNHVAEEGRPLEALNYFLAAIRLEPKEALYHYQLGTLLAEARDDFLKSGEWTSEKIDASLLRAFKEASRLQPDNWRYAYRYGLAFYDVERPDWGEALEFWRTFESQLKPGVEQQTCRLHQARVLASQGHRAQAEAVLATVTEPALAKHREKLAAEWVATAKLAEPVDAASSK